MHHAIVTRNAGLSLVEMMVAVLISLFLIAGVISLFVASKRAYTDSERFSRTQEGARFAMVTLASDLRMAGFLGGSEAASIGLDAALNRTVDNNCSDDAAAYDISTILAATTSDNSGNAYGCITDAVAGAQVLVVKHVRPNPLDPTTATLDNRRTYVISGPTTGLLFDGADGVPSSAQVQDAALWEYLVHVYYVRNLTVPTLSRKTLRMGSGSNMSMVTEDLVPGVELMRFEFGIDGDGDGVLERFVNTISSSNQDRVGAVRVHLLLRDEQSDAHYTDTKTYDLGGVTYTPDDNFHRTVLSSTVSLRNRLFAIREGL